MRCDAMESGGAGWSCHVRGRHGPAFPLALWFRVRTQDPVPSWHGMGGEPLARVALRPTGSPPPPFHAQKGAHPPFEGLAGSLSFAPSVGWLWGLPPAQLVGSP